MGPDNVQGLHAYFITQFGRRRDVPVPPSGKVYICADNGNNTAMFIEFIRGKIRILFCRL